MPDARDGLDLAEWFDDDELETCPHCGRRHLTVGPAVSGFRTCLTCGPVEEPDTDQSA